MTDEQATHDDRKAILERIWLAEARAIAAILEKTPPEELQAATLNTIRQFLGDNGVNIDTLEKNGGGNYEHLVKALAELKEEEADGEPLPTPDWPDREEE